MQPVSWTRVVILSACVILSSVAGNALLSAGVKSQADDGWLSTLLSPLVIAGIVLLIGWMLFRMALLSITPMSVVLPLTAGIAYLLTSAVGQILLHEKVGRGHVYGLAFIVAGALLIGSSTPHDAGDVE